MHLGLDFDNTVVTYDRLFHRAALERGLIDAAVPLSKREVRDAIRLLPGGERSWTELQGVVYGRRMAEAEPAPGVERFLAACSAAGVRVSIISHKTEYPAIGERVSLRDAARAWLAARGLLERHGIAPADVLFVGTLAEKLAAIAARGCTHFVDDLVEVLGHPAFPAGVERILYAPPGAAPPAGVVAFDSWDEIGRHLLGAAPPLPGGVREALERERGAAVTAARRRRAGANSEVWEVETAGGARYFVKRYPPPGPGEGDRLATEFAALGFLARHGVRQVPEAVAALPELRVGVFGLVAGTALEPGGIGGPEVAQAVAFLARLHELRGAAGARELPVAKEACFSIAAHEELVRTRVERLRAGCADGALRAFLDDELAPHLDRVSSRVGASAAAGLDLRAELPAGARTLSPSDFGFHNALRRADGTLAFVDFEYFGWDDPAKTVADFVLQPALPVPDALRQSCCRELLRVYGPAADLARRLPLVHALLGVKWCLIVLNVFLRPLRGADAAALRGERLARARELLARARRDLDAGAFTQIGG